MSSNTSSARMPPARMTTPQIPSEEINISLVKEYMRIAYSPTENHGRQSVAHLCLDDAWFWAPTTFPGVESPQEYAESHSQVMASIADLHIVCYDQVFAKDGHVLLRYTAEGSHCGEAHDGIEKSGKKAKWSAAAIFEVEDGKIKSFTKDWDKLHMWKQLGWMKGDEYV